MQHLCSRTLRPSHTERFEDAWTFSLEVSRANPSVLLESVKLLKTPDTSSPTSQTESESANLELFSLKTYKGSSPARQQTESQFSNMSSESWKQWVIEQRQEYSQRKKSAHLTRESESSYLGWPTASLSDPEGGSQADRVEWTQTGAKLRKKDKPHMTYGAKLRDAVENYEKNWATPQTFDANNLVRTPEKLAQTRAEKNAGCMNLREQVHYPDMDHSRKAAQNWPTPTAVNRVRDEETMEKCLKFRQSNGQTSVPLYLEEKVIREPQNWPTPTTAEGTKIGNQANFGQVGLSNHPSIVGQPDRAKLNKSGKSQESWSTPQARDWKGAEGRAYKGQTKDLPAQTQAMGKLNPDWVEHLMGLPVGWTDLGSWETE